MNINLETVNRFIDWTQLKMQLQHTVVTFFPRKKEIWWASLGQNVGIEVNGKNNRFERPVLILTVFNTEAIFVVSLTSKIKENEYIYQFTDTNGVKSAVNISQVRTISSKRLLRKVGEMSDDDYKKVVQLLQSHVIKAETPQNGVSSELSV